MTTPSLAEIRVALVLASDALEIAEGSCPHVQIDPPKHWQLPGGDESARDGWCTTGSLAKKLNKLAKTIDLEIKESAPAKGDSVAPRRLELMKPGRGYQSTWLDASFLHSAPSARIYVDSGKIWAQLEHPQGGPLGCVKCPHAGAVGVQKVDGRWHWVIEEGQTS